MKLVSRRRAFSGLGLGGLAMVLRQDQTTPRTAKPGPTTAMGYRQGTIIEWNAVTLANKVSIDGVPMENLAVLGVAEAASYSPGVNVGIVAVGSSWAIAGRFVLPGTADAQDAITQIGQQTHVAVVTASATTSSTSFTDLAGSFGPEIEDIFARASGKAAVTVSALLAPGDFLPGTAAMDFEVTWSGGVFRSPALETALMIGTTNNDGVVAGGSRTTYVEGLTPGVPYTFTAKYRHANGVDADFQQRQIAVEYL